jgi:hypothetical protein
VFLASPRGVDISLVESTIRNANWDVVDRADNVGISRQSIRDALSMADALIVAGGVHAPTDLSSLMLEVGIALGLGKPVLVVWEESVPLPRVFPSELRVMRISLRNPDALRFHLEVFLANVRDGATAARTEVGVRASEDDVLRLFERLKMLQSLDSRTGPDFVLWIEDLFRSLGSKSVPATRAIDRGFDLVLSAPFDLALNGPVLVEAKTYLPRGNQLQRVTERLASVVASEGASLGILVILAAPELQSGRQLAGTSPLVSIFSADRLLGLVAAEASLADILLSAGEEKWQS